jgi:hypothetical protein
MIVGAQKDVLCFQMSEGSGAPIGFANSKCIPSQSRNGDEEFANLEKLYGSSASIDGKEATSEWRAK